jgi:branched-chain amino acid transport system permease protein
MRVRSAWTGINETLPVWGIVSYICLALLILNLANDALLYEIGLALVYALAALGQDTLIGHAGQVSLGAAAFMGVGAFTTQKLAAMAWAPFPLPIVGAAVVGAAVGFAFGIPGLRFRGLYLALATLSLQFIFQFAGQEYQGNTNQAGFTLLPPSLAGYTFTPGRPFTVLMIVVVGLVSLFLWRTYHTVPGRAWSAIRQGETAAATTGLNVRRWKLVSFALGSAVTAMAGGFFGYMISSVNYTTYTLDTTVTLIAIIFVGGIRSISGTLLGAALVTLLPYELQQWTTSGGGGLAGWISTNAPQVSQIIYGLALLLVLLFERDGLRGLLVRAAAGGVRLARRRLRAAPGRAPDLVKAEHEPPPDSPGADEAGAEPILTLVAASAGNERPPGAVGATGQAPEKTLLEIRGLRVRYASGALGLDGLDLVVPQGKIVAVIGRNGAGKTTALRGIAGFPRSERVSVRGSVILDGRELRGRSPFAVHRLGIEYVSERDKVFASLRVCDHFRLARRRGARAQTAADVGSTFPSLQRRWDVRAGLLSGGERQMLALAMAWLSDPSVLLVDELSLGLAPVVVRDLMTTLRNVAAERATTILIVEQDIVSASQIADYLHVMDRGRIIWSGPSTAMSAAEASRLLLAEA